MKIEKRGDIEMYLDQINQEDKKLYSESYNEIEKLYNEYEYQLPVEDLIKETNFSQDDILIFYIFDSDKNRKMGDPIFMCALLDFLKANNMEKHSNASTIKKFVDEKFLYLKNVNYWDGEKFTLSDISFINKVYIKRIPLQLGYSFSIHAYIHEHEITVEHYGENQFNVNFNYDVFRMDKISKNQFSEYFDNCNKEIRKVILKELSFIEEKVKEFDSVTKRIIYNFIGEIEDTFFLHPNLFTSLEHMVAYSNYFGEYVVESTKEERHNIAINLNKNQDVFDYLFKFEEKYDKLITILTNKIDMKENLIGAAIWLELKGQVIVYFSSNWKTDYGKYFEDSTSDESAEDFIITYFNINEIDSMNEKNLGRVTYYLMHLGLLKHGDRFNDNFYYVKNVVEVMTDKMKLKKFEEKLMVEDRKNKTYFSDLDFLTGLEFEQFIADLFTKMGYLATKTKASGDQGIDVVVKKDGREIGIQTKCYSSKVSNTAIQEVAAGIAYHKCNRGMVITNNYFTKSAIELADKNNVILWDREILKEKFEEFINN